MKNIIKKSNGANFRLADLHLHSPADSRFTCPDGLDLQNAAGREEFARRYVQAALARHLSIIAVTDHNDIEWVDDIRRAAERTDLTVLPGFEVNAHSGSEGIHLVCLFEPDRPREHLDDIITELGLPRGERVHDDGTSKLCKYNLEEAIEFIRDKGGVTVAAHVLRGHGILRKESMSGEVRVQAWKNKHLLACEIPKARSGYDGEETFAAKAIRNEADLYKRERPIACVYASDARALEELGRRPTYIKLSAPTIRGLKHAFLDWESRIRHPDELSGDAFSRVIAAEWEGGFLDGLAVHFNDNLNCIIGGKGTGKSTIVETIRFALGLEPMAKDPRQQFKDIIKNVFRPGSTVRVLVENHSPTPTRYLVERSVASDPTVYRWDDDSNARGEELVGVRPQDIFPGVEVYGQKEILEMSNDESTQIGLLERFVDRKSVVELVDQEQSLIAQLADNSKALLELEEQADAVAEKGQRLATLREKLERYKALGLDVKLVDEKNHVTEQDLLERTEQSLGDSEAAVAEFASAADVESSFLGPSEVEGLPHAELLGATRETLETLSGELGKAARLAEAAVATARAACKTSLKRWEADYKVQQDAYNSVLRELQTDTIDPDDYIQTERAIARLERETSSTESVTERQRELSDTRSKLLNELDRVRRKKFQRRQAAEKLVNAELEGVLEVEMRYEGQREWFVELVSDLRTGARREQLVRIVEHEQFSPRRVGQALRAGSEELSTTFDITSSAAQTLCSKIDRRKTFELEIAEIPASVSIRLNIGTPDHANFRETDRLSVGQRCTAILMLILLHGRYPLVVDQPEDDLDNSFVYTDIVQRLRTEKERRQFIIATHNANIPVLGDAELMQVLHAERGSLVLDECFSGSIDDERLRGPVETILEGGKEAFEFRRAKYGF